MEFDWNNPPFELDGSLTVRDIEESFEDPFAIRLLPDSPRYFDTHHTTQDSLDKVNPRELHLGAAALTALVWLADTQGL